MTKDELNLYTKYNEMFINECQRVANILSKYQIEEFQYIKFADEFELSGDCVLWRGDEYWGYGGHEQHCGNFSVAYLTMSDEELNNIAKRLEEKYLDKLHKKKLKIEEQNKKDEYEQYLKLKKKFELK